MIRNKGLIPLALLFAFSALAQPPVAGVQKITSVEGITEYALPNGLHVLLFPDASKPNVTVNMTYMVGSRHEGYGETGMAHLLEHMLFLKTKTRKDVKQELKDHGAEMNGSTSWDRTNYFETLNATDENLKFALATRGRPHGQQPDREAASRYRNDRGPQRIRNAREQPRGHRSSSAPWKPLSPGTTTGSSRSATAPTSKMCRSSKLAAFYQKYYQPDNALLTDRRQVRRGQDPGHGRQVLRRHPQAHPHPRKVLHRRAHPGWRTLRHPAPRRRYPGPGRPLPRPVRIPPGRRRARSPRRRPRRPSVRPSLQSPRR